jgi:hypothetical protein
MLRRIVAISSKIGTLITRVSRVKLKMRFRVASITLPTLLFAIRS